MERVDLNALRATPPMKPVTWKSLSARQRLAALQRPAQASRDTISATVAEIIATVRREGDDALRIYTAKFDGAELRSLKVNAAEFAEAEKILGAADKSALRTAYRNLRRFHLAQRPASIRVETMPGIVCEKISRPVGSVGLYVPGGSAPLFSTALMLGVPSQIAGNPGRVL